MDVKESYRVLELAIGASRAEVEAAYCRLIERWHPDRAASAGPEVVREAQRMVQAINDAYRTLAAIAPTTAKPSAPMPTRAASPAPTNAAPDAGAKSAAPPPTSATPPAGNKPRIAPLSIGQPDLNRPPPRPPPPESWAGRSAPVGGAPPPPTPASPPAPPPTDFPPPPPPPASHSATPPATQSATTPATTPPAAAAPPTPPAPDPVAFAPEAPAAPPTSFSDRLVKVADYYNALFPVGTPRRRFGPVILAAALILVLLLGKCAFSSSGSKRAREPDPRTTGRLVVKSNLANATIEATRIPAPDDATTTRVNGAIDQALAGLPPGNYAVTARSEGWPEIHKEVSLDAGRTTEVAMNFKGGSLHLDSDPPGATVRLGETVLGRTPLVVPLLPPGECKLSLDYPSWPVASFETTIAEGVDSTVTVRLPHGKLTVGTSPPGATVLLGRRTLGRTPLTLDPFPAGTRKLTLQARDFPALEYSVTVEDHGEVNVHPALGSGFPVLDPAALLRNVWVQDNSDDIAPPLEGLSGPSKPKNGIIRNLNRKRLYDYWMRKRYVFTAIVKSYDRAAGQVELSEQQNEYSRYRVLANLSSEARHDQELTGQLVKGATFAFYGRLSAVEEPHWPSKVITFEFSSVEPLR